MNKKTKPRVPVHHSTRDRPLSSARPTGNAKMNVLGQNSKDGVYANQRIVHSCSSLIGAKVTIETVNGGTFEGIFRTFSPQLELTIELVHLVDKDDPEKISEEAVRQTMVFPMQDIVRCSAIDTDLSFATKDGFRTDSQIANCNGEAPMRELEQWIPDGVDNADFHELSLDNANGWRAEEMFEKNEREFHVKSTYSSALEGYTVPLKVEDTKEYRELEARAELLAREIEGNQSNRSNIELEDGDEEETFSAVMRPDKGDDSSNESDQVRKYVPPARRHQNSYNHSGRGDHRVGPRLNNPPFNNHHNPSSTSPPNRESVNKGTRNDKDYQKSPSMSPHGSSPSAYSSRDHHSHDTRHDDQVRSSGGNSQNNGHRRSQHFGQGNGREQSRSAEQEASHPSQRQHQQSRVGGFPSYPQLSRSHREQVSDLKDFHTKFLLATPSSVTLDLSGLKVKPQVHHTIQHLSEIRARSGSPQEHQQTSPKPVQQQGHPLQQQQAFQQQMPVRPETTTQFQQIPVRPETSTGTNLNLQRQQSSSEPSINQDISSPSADETSQARQPSPQQHSQQQSPVCVQNPSSPSQVSSGGKKSSLNPLAKEFVLNPNAKVFVPGNASGSSAALSSTPPQRPITPGTPMPYPSNAITPHQQFIQGAPAVQPHIYPYGAQQGAPYPFHPNGSIGALPPQSQQQHQRFRPNANNQGPRQQGIPPMDIPPNSQMIVQGVPPMMTGNVPQAHQGPHPQSFIQFQHQSHQFNAAATMMQANANMLMRLPPSAMNQMMVAQSPTTPPMPMTTIGAIMDNAAGPHPMAVAWMQQHQGQAPLPHITGVPPPQGNHMGPGHLGQPPPQPQMSSGGGPQQHTPAQVAAVQAAVAQAQQQAVASNGSHTPAPSPGPMSVYSPSGPQFSQGYPGMLMLPPGGPHHGMIQQTMMPGQGQGVPPPHHSQMQVHQFTMHQHPQMVPGQQNAPHLMLQP